MSDKFLCVIAGYDEMTEKHLAGIQNELYNAGFIGTHTKDLPQHITLGSFATEREDEVLSLVKQIAEETESFDVTFSHIGLFQGSKVLFIAPDPNKKLLDLKEHFGESFCWTPHTTMLIDEPEKVFAALTIVASEFSAFQGKVENIHLYEFWPTRHIISLNFTK